MQPAPAPHPIPPALEAAARALLASHGVTPDVVLWDCTRSWGARRPGVTARQLVLRYLLYVGEKIQEEA